MYLVTVLKKYTFESIFLAFCLIFSFWLMFHTFSHSDGSMLIAGKAWSDFASHIPLIRSFSLGDNFPPEYPIFPGEPIRYHFLFYALVGFSERLGLPIDLALNIPSALSFFLLMISIYFLTLALFKRKSVAILAVIFFLFNGSLSFLEFFKTYPLEINTITNILENTQFPSFGPYDGKIVSAFWNLNIYTNQRHLALPIAILLLMVCAIIFFIRRKKNLPWKFVLLFGVIIGILPLSHSSLFIMSISVLSILFVLFPRQRLRIFLTLVLSFLISLPRIYFLGSTATFSPQIHIGYLVQDLTMQHILTYWIYNFGLFFFMIPLGVLFANRFQQKVFLSFLSVFIIGNAIQFSPEVASNHKFFNVFLIVGHMFAAYAVVRLWHSRFPARTIVPTLLCFMILSGIIEFFPIKNDGFIQLHDYPQNTDISWIVRNTPGDSVFLNSSYIFNPASLAGRKIFLGWPYFSWSLGYDTTERDDLRKKLLSTNNKIFFCEESKKHNITYAILDMKDEELINWNFFQRNFPKSYESKNHELTVYKISCQDTIMQ